MYVREKKQQGEKINDDQGGKKKLGLKKRPTRFLRKKKKTQVILGLHEFLRKFKFSLWPDYTVNFYYFNGLQTLCRTPNSCVS